MAAGFAGGIGLSGGGCGALGAAIWLISMQEIEDGVFKLSMESPRAQAAIERYLASADYEFECATSWTGSSRISTIMPRTCGTAAARRSSRRWRLRYRTRTP